jgi:uncharacterized membrane protein
MPTTLSTTVRHIYDRIPNYVNSKLIEDFHHFMKDNNAFEDIRIITLKLLLLLLKLFYRQKHFLSVIQLSLILMMNPFTYGNLAPLGPR